MTRICETQRVRRWATRNGIVPIDPDCHVLPRYLHGGDLALAYVNALRQGGPRKRTMRAGIRIVRPPEGGWVGGTA